MLQGFDTVVVAVPLLLEGLESGVVAEIIAVLVIVEASGSVGLTSTVSVNTAVPGVNEGMDEDTVPPAPTIGLVLFQPPGEVNETKVVPAGKVLEIETEAALLGPELVTEMV
jgi:hypothetical protein